MYPSVKPKFPEITSCMKRYNEQEMRRLYAKWQECLARPTRFFVKKKAL
ncbi:hypothetical protein C900_05910 [Fulvivirga imtechensis AK7]|uniref:Uncharacterized protein n=1 Tax=Fulvivirga imtechensis AK7 TaxID=1237149 RepID=L8JMY0_9BACT|nr:hypothetical protein C900_05910 [Fulvivirga imtechensis AK7]